MIPFVNLHTHNIDNQVDVISILNLYPEEELLENQKFSIGIHPWRIKENWQQELEIIEKCLVLENCLAIGECGIDKRIETEVSIQIEVFEAQIALAKKHKKPLILHCVAGFEEILKVLNQHNFQEKVVFHGFSKSEQLAKELIQKGYFLSFGKYLLENEDLALVFRNTNSNQILLETDNSKYSLQEIYEKASKIKQITIEEMKNMVYENYKNIFH